MTALEQLQQARQAFLLAERAVWSFSGDINTRNLTRKVAYGLWLDACRRFRAEGR